MKPCPEYHPLLLDRAAGVLPPETEARLDGHLQGCLACRAESKALGEALSLAALPPASEAERQALDGLAGETLRALRKDRSRRTLWRGVGAGIAIAAAAAAAVAVVPVLRHGKSVPATAVQATWQEPDLDAIWEASGAAMNEASGDDSGSDEVPIFADLYDPDSM